MKETKYYMFGTDDEVQFGDHIEVNFTEDTDKGTTKHYHFDCKFIPELVPMLLEHEVIEAEEAEEDDEDVPTTTESGSDFDVDMDTLIKDYLKATDTERNKAIEVLTEISNSLTSILEDIKTTNKLIKLIVESKAEESKAEATKPKTKK